MSKKSYKPDATKPQSPKEAHVCSPMDLIDEVVEMHPWLIPETMTTVTSRIASMNARREIKLKKLTELATKVDHTLQPHYTCRKGCSHCCSMVTLIYRHEAARLSEVTGRRMVELPYRRKDEVLRASMRSYGKQCPFVVDGSCSVYEDRPLICRLHHSFNPDPSDCRVSVPVKRRTGIAMYDPDIIEVPYHEVVHAGNLREPWGAITEFFVEQE